MSKQVEGLERKLTDPFFKYTDEDTLKKLFPNIPILYADLEYALGKNNDSEITPIK